MSPDGVRTGTLPVRQKSKSCLYFPSLEFMGYVTTNGILIDRIDFSETSQVIRVFSRKKGRISAIAKGARREKSSFNGPFDLFTVGKFTWISRPPDRLNILTECKRKKSLLALRNRLPRYYSASWITVFLRRLTPEGTPEPELYRLARSALDELTSSRQERNIVNMFDLKGLNLLGYLPRMVECSFCHSTFSPGTTVRFHYLAGGPVCSGCLTKENKKQRRIHLRNSQFHSPSLGTLKAIQKIVSSSGSDGFSVQLTSDQSRDVFRMMTHCFGCILRNLPSIRTSLYHRL